MTMLWLLARNGVAKLESAHPRRPLGSSASDFGQDAPVLERIREPRSGFGREPDAAPVLPLSNAKPARVS